MKPKFYFDIPQHIFDPSNPWNFQTNEDWLALRRDRLTASLANDLLAKARTVDGLSNTIRRTINKRVMQFYTTWIDDECVSFQEREEVQRGLVYEQEARNWYESVTGDKVTECGFVERGKYLGCSPDGLILDKQRTVQIKIPMPANYLSKCFDWSEYVNQCQCEMLVCGFNNADLVIYSPELGTGKRIGIKRDNSIFARILSQMRIAVSYRNWAMQEIENQLCKNDYVVQNESDIIGM